MVKDTKITKLTRKSPEPLNTTKQETVNNNVQKFKSHSNSFQKTNIQVVNTTIDQHSKPKTGVNPNENLENIKPAKTQQHAQISQNTVIKSPEEQNLKTVINVMHNPTLLNQTKASKPVQSSISFHNILTESNNKSNESTSMG